MNSQLYQEHYQEEWRRRAEIEATYNLPVTVFTVLGGAIYLMIRGQSDDHLSGVLASVSLVGAAVFYVAALRYLVRSMYGYTYQRIPTARQLGSYYDELVKFHEAAGRTERDAHVDFESYLNDRYAEATEVNSRNNISKSEFLHRGNQWLIGTLSAVILAAIPALYHAHSHTDEPQVVEIGSVVQIEQRGGPEVSTKQSSDEGSGSEQQPQQQPPQEPPQPAEQPQKPVGPPNIEVHEGQQPQKPVGPENIEVREEQRPKETTSR
jgi:hypothetical protein